MTTHTNIHVKDGDIQNGQIFSQVEVGPKQTRRIIYLGPVSITFEDKVALKTFIRKATMLRDAPEENAYI